MSTVAVIEQNANTRNQMVVALAGNPNTGKTTLFNALTGLRQKVANYPGITVESKEGVWHIADGTITMHLLSMRASLPIF